MRLAGAYLTASSCRNCPQEVKAPDITNHTSCLASGSLNEVAAAAIPLKTRAQPTRTPSMVLLRQRARQDDAGGGKEGDAESGEVAEMQLAKARLHHQHDTSKAGDHSQPAPWADLFLEHQRRENGDAERRQEDQCVDFSQRNGGEGIDAEQARCHAGPGAGACTAHGRFVRQKPRQRSSAGRLKNRKPPANSVTKKAISKTVNCPPRLLITASLHE